MTDVVVIGAGISGLTCAWQLRRAGIDAAVLEAGPRPGGVIATHEVDGYLIESGPNTILPTPGAGEIVREAGLDGELVSAPRGAPRFVYVGGRLRRAPWVMSAKGIARALVEPLQPARTSAGEESLADFIRRRFGAEVHDRLAAPFVGGIYAGDTARLGVEAAFPRLSELERRYGSVIVGMIRSRSRSRRGRLSSFKRGMAALPDGLARDLDVRLRAGEVRLDHAGGTWRVASGAWDGEARALVLATPAAAAARLLEPVDASLAGLLESVWYAPIVVAAAGITPDRALEGFGFLVPRTEGLHLLGTLFSSSLFPGRAPEGRALLTSFIGGAHEPEAVEWPDTRIWEVLDHEVRRVLRFGAGLEPLRLYRYAAGIPQYRPGHRAWRKAVRSRVEAREGLFLTGNYLDGVSLPSAMEHGRETAEAVAAYIRRER